MQIDPYARALFGSAGVANLTVAFGLVFLHPLLAPVLALDPAGGTNLTMLYLAASCIAVFGYTYFRVALDPVAFRPCIHVGALGKLVAVVVSAVPWWRGETSWRFPALISGDLVFALLFLDYLRRTAVERRA